MFSKNVIKSNLAKANENRDYRIFEEFEDDRIELAINKFTNENFVCVRIALFNKNLTKYYLIKIIIRYQKNNVIINVISTYLKRILINIMINYFKIKLIN